MSAQKPTVPEKVLPHTLVFPDRFLTLLDEMAPYRTLRSAPCHPDRAVFSTSSSTGKTVRVPSGLTRHTIYPFIVLVTRNHILDNTGQHMTNMRFSVRSWRSIVKHICWCPFAKFNTICGKYLCLSKTFLLLFLSRQNSCLLILCYT